MLMVEESTLLNIYFESFHIPVGVFSFQGEQEKLLIEGGQIYKKRYTDDAMSALKKAGTQDFPVMCYDSRGSCWGVIPYNGKRILIGPVQTGRNRNYGYVHVPELNWNSFRAVIMSLAKLLTGEKAEITELRRQSYEDREDIRFPELQEEVRYQLKSYNELYDCVRKGDLANLKKILNSEDLQSYMDQVITDRKTAERVFQFALTRAYHTARETCGTAEELNRISAYYMNAGTNGKYDLSARATFQRMMYEFTYYVWQYHNGDYSRLTNKVLYYINEHIDDQITMEALSAYCMTGVSTLQHHIKADTGKTITGLIREKKIEKACYFLAYTELPCNDIALRLHYGSQSYFIGQFRKEKGMTPLMYRRKIQEENQRI